MNVITSSLNIVTRPEKLLAQLVAYQKAGAAPALVKRHCLKIQDGYGFVFGTGLIAHFLEHYYAKGNYGAGRAVWILLRSISSQAVGGAYARHIFRRFRGQFCVDGQTLPWNELLGLGAGTVSEVGLGFRLIHRADDHPHRFGILAMHSSPLALTLDLAAVHHGRGVSSRRAWSASATHLVIEPDEPEILYTIDGDLYRTRGPLNVELGPELSFVRPRGG